jgi:hypothetical protein
MVCLCLVAPFPKKRAHGHGWPIAGLFAAAGRHHDGGDGGDESGGARQKKGYWPL